MITDTNIKIKYRRAYGNEFLEPLCETGKYFARLTGTKTLTRQAISIIKALGYTVEVVQDKIEV